MQRITERAAAGLAFNLAGRILPHAHDSKDDRAARNPSFSLAAPVQEAGRRPVPNIPVTASFSSRSTTGSGFT